MLRAKRLEKKFHFGILQTSEAVHRSELASPCNLPPNQTDLAEITDNKQ